MSEFDEGYALGKKHAVRDLAPLIEAANDAAFMLSNVNKASHTREWQQQFEAMGTQLRRLLKLAKLMED